MSLVHIERSKWVQNVKIGGRGGGCRGRRNDGDRSYWLKWMTYRRLFHEAALQPLFDGVQVQVNADQAQLAPPLDQLVGLHHQPLHGKANPV